MVGLWAAIDAYRERAGENVNAALSKPPPLWADWRELDDLRNLFAHNFAGVADATYFKRPRTIAQGVASTLRSGGAFDGHRVVLAADHLRYYVAQGRLILATL